MDLKTKLKILQLEKDITTQELAAALNLTPLSVYRWRNGDRLPSTEHLKALKEILGEDLGAYK